MLIGIAYMHIYVRKQCRILKGNGDLYLWHYRLYHEMIMHGTDFKYKNCNDINFRVLLIMIYAVPYYIYIYIYIYILEILQNVYSMYSAGLWKNMHDTILIDCVWLYWSIKNKDRREAEITQHAIVAIFASK